MKEREKKVCYLSFDGMTDPLGQSQVIPYLIKLSEKGFDFHLISVEKPSNLDKKRDAIESILSEYEIKWTTILYSNKIPFVSTAQTLKKVFKIASNILKNEEFNLIHFRGYTLGNTVRKLKKKFKVPVIFDMRSFLPDERVLGGMWNLKNPLHYCIYKYFKYLEGRFYIEFERTISQTNLGKQTIRDWGYSEELVKVEVVTCCADLNFFNYSNYSSENLFVREQLGIGVGDFILGYVGSIGTWYCLDDMMSFFKVLLIEKPNAKFVFLSPVDPKVVFDSAKEIGVPVDSIRVKFLDRMLMPKYISIFDWSIFFIKPGVGKAASCPVKHGELMGMGVPVIANSLVGDMDLIIGEEASGLIVKSFNKSQYHEVIRKLPLFPVSKKEIREVGFKYYDLDSGVASYYKIYKEILK